MISDEEREALDKLTRKKNETTWDDTIRQIKREEIKDVVVTRQKYITAVLNLIEKQSKEIEELKEKNENLLDAFNNSIDIKKYWVNKDKIKAKIEEVEPMTFPYVIYHATLREDEAKECLSNDEVLANSKDKKADQIKVPKVVG